MNAHALAGKRAPSNLLCDVGELLRAYEGPAQSSVSFGTSGHRGSSFAGSFNRAHVVAIAHAVVDYRTGAGISGPILIGRDTHGLSEPAYRQIVEVLVSREAAVLVDADDRCTPTPLVSHAIIEHNRGSKSQADGIVVTPSHNPPEDGGIKYNPPHGGPAEEQITKWIEARANEYLHENRETPESAPYEQALKRDNLGRFDFVTSYVSQLDQVVNMQAIQEAGVRIGLDPLGGAGLDTWNRIGEQWGIAIEVVSPTIDPTFSSVPIDFDGKIRMDCSSPYPMQTLVSQSDRFDIGVGNDADADRHGIVTGAGLMNPNHYLAAALDGLLMTRDAWPTSAGLGKTVVTSSLLERVASKWKRQTLDMPVGFKWFVDGLNTGSLCFAGEESAGASFLRFDGGVWTTDKDGILLGLVAAEMLAVSGKNPAERYRDLVAEVGEPHFARTDEGISAEDKKTLLGMSPDQISATELAGEPISGVFTDAPGSGTSMGGLKLVTSSGWFAARPSGTEDKLKIYTESFEGEEHLARLQEEGRGVLDALFGANG